MLILAPVGEDAEQLEHTITDRNAKMGHLTLENGLATSYQMKQTYHKTDLSNSWVFTLEK